jgi:hypothetical protein
MATEIYSIDYVETVDGVEIEISPLKIKYMRKFMNAFSTIVDNKKTEDQTIDILSECVRISMEQFCPELSKSVEDIQEAFDIKSLYKVLDIAAGIRMNTSMTEEEVIEKVTEKNQSSSWEDLDLAKLESEVFCLGIWKNYDELERAISLQEMMSILSTSRELTYEERKFSAAIQGIDLDSGNDKDGEVKGQQEWENMKARVFSGGATSDSNDILALQGHNAQRAGFGIGMGLSYQDMRDPEVLIKP